MIEDIQLELNGKLWLVSGLGTADDAKRRIGRRKVRYISYTETIYRLEIATDPRSYPIGIYVCHGGTVPNSYGWIAHTECLVIVADHAWRCAYVQYGFVPANKATLAGAARIHSADLSTIYDERYGADRKLDAMVRLAEWCAKRRPYTVALPPEGSVERMIIDDGMAQGMQP